MIEYTIRRIFQFVPTFIGATILAFTIIQLSPGDFTDQFRLNVADRQAEEQLERLRTRLGLDQPVHIQYFMWFGQFVTTGYLGESFTARQPVAHAIRGPMINSMILVATALVFIWLVGIAAGVFTAVRQYTLGDQVVTIASFIGLSIPNFFQALLVILLALHLHDWTGVRILPTGQMTSPGFDHMSLVDQILNRMWHMTVPVFVLVTSDVASLVRFMRGQMLEFLKSDFIRTARAKGLAERSVLYKHAMRNAIVPFVAGIGSILPGLIGGAGLIEVVYGWPGVTPIILDAFNQIDLYVIMGVIVVTNILLIIGNLISDILLAVVDPRIRY